MAVSSYSFSPSQSLSNRHVILPLPYYSQPLSFVGISRHFQPSIRVRSSLPISSLHHNKGGSSSVVSGRSWEKKVLKSEMPVLVEFHASWCGPCSMVHRVIEEVAEEYAGRLKCYILHTDNELEVADKYDIKAVPVVLLFNNGHKHASIVGTMPKDFYVAAIQSLLTPTPTSSSSCSTHN